MALPWPSRAATLARPAARTFRKLSAAARHDHAPGGIDEMPPAIERRIHADLAVRGDDVETVDDDAAQPRALADRGVVHDDRVLDRGALVDPHGATEDRVANRGALHERRFADVSVVD